MDEWIFEMMMMKCSYKLSHLYFDSAEDKYRLFLILSQDYFFLSILIFLKSPKFGMWPWKDEAKSASWLLMLMFILQCPTQYEILRLSSLHKAENGFDLYSENNRGLK